MKLLLSLTTAILLFVIGIATGNIAVNPPVKVKTYPVAGLYLCAGDSCLQLPPGATLSIPQTVPPGPWDAFSAKSRL